MERHALRNRDARRSRGLGQQIVKMARLAQAEYRPVLNELDIRQRRHHDRRQVHWARAVVLCFPNISEKLR
jgi:hypothetical protein